MHLSEDESSIHKKRQDFKKHLRVYIVINGFLLFLNLFTSPSYLWAIWPIMGWGIGIALQALSVYGPLKDEDHNTSGTTTEERPYQQENDSLDLDDLPRKSKQPNTYDNEDFV